MSAIHSPAVTGATGFIGRRLVARLCEQGARPRVLVRPGTHVPKTWDGNVDVFIGDVRDSSSLPSFLDGATVVFHLAAMVGDWGKESDFHAITVEGTRRVFSEAAARNTRAILASSIVVYGTAMNDETCNEDISWGRAAGMYSRAKQAQERVALELAQSRGLALTVVRPANVYGPRASSWVERLVVQLRKKMPALIGNGHCNANLIYVDNLVDIFLRAASVPEAIGKAYNACDGLDVTWNQYVHDLARIANAPTPRNLPRIFAKTSAHACETVWSILGLKQRPPVTHEALSLVDARGTFPIDRIKSELDFAPRVGYREALDAIAASLQQEFVK